MIKVICCYSLLSSPGARTFSRCFALNLVPHRAFATNLVPHRALSSVLKIEKLKAPLNPGPEGGGGYK